MSSIRMAARNKPNGRMVYCRSESLAANWIGPPMTRYMLKWCCWRLAAPARDWLPDEESEGGFNFATGPYPPPAHTLHKKEGHGVRL